jgi:hypothetical protein
MTQTGNNSHDLLEWAISERWEIKQAIDKLELRLKNVNSAAVATMTKLNLKSFKSDLGSLALKEGGVSHGIDKVKLTEALLSSGLSAAKVAEIMEAADKPTVRQASIAFTPDRTPANG